mmetsp:Transcript_3794/g.7995  ORF Transcript_3794/g.7995 Transcript_3794/m.7995 type:complete len:377 (+) Transcript_3794:794-1924(+)
MKALNAAEGKRRGGHSQSPTTAENVLRRQMPATATPAKACIPARPVWQRKRHRQPKLPTQCIEMPIQETKVPSGDARAVATEASALHDPAVCSCQRRTLERLVTLDQRPNFWKTRNQKLTSRHLATKRWKSTNQEHWQKAPVHARRAFAADLRMSIGCRQQSYPPWHHPLALVDRAPDRCQCHGPLRHADRQDPPLAAFGRLLPSGAAVALGHRELPTALPALGFHHQKHKAAPTPSGSHHKASPPCPASESHHQAPPPCPASESHHKAPPPCPASEPHHKAPPPCPASGSHHRSPLPRPDPESHHKVPPPFPSLGSHSPPSMAWKRTAGAHRVLGQVLSCLKFEPAGQRRKKQAKHRTRPEAPHQPGSRDKTQQY